MLPRLDDEGTSRLSGGAGKLVVPGARGWSPRVVGRGDFLSKNPYHFYGKSRIFEVA